MIDWTVPARRKLLSRFTPGESCLTAPRIDDPLNDAVTAVRRIIGALARTAPDDGGLPAAAAELQRIAEALEGRTRPVPAHLSEMWRGEGIARHDPATGPENPLAPPLTMRDVGDGWAEGVVTLGLPYQGPPALVHGGVCGLLLDAALAVANQLAGVGGMTAQLDITYRRPTPLYVPLTVRARQLRREGRKLFTIGEIVADGQVTVSARGLFICAADSVGIVT
ncbi:PaaI family thioesterase [Nocardia miyunensis]|uniref:PaaI family thioesterase n=1 Tax=Nocardia miyunensis TaxID=282684 RepID=UPI000829D635|nr:hotdog domain-containing protein [Nocardia miyunensis]